jgi:hypothetical protein
LNAPCRGSPGRRLFDFDDCFICHTYPCCLTYQRVDASRSCPAFQQLSCHTCSSHNLLFLNTIFIRRFLRWGALAPSKSALEARILDKTGVCAPEAKKPRWGTFAPVRGLR